MGLDIYCAECRPLHDPETPCYSSSYSGFGAMRWAVCAAVPPDDMRRDMPGFALFMAHSDCDGELSTEECVQVMAALFDVRLTSGSNDAYKLAMFRDLLAHCINHKHKMVFF